MVKIGEYVTNDEAFEKVKMQNTIRIPHRLFSRCLVGCEPKVAEFIEDSSIKAGPLLIVSDC